MTTQSETGGRAAWVDEQAVREFLASHGPNGPADDPELSWESELDSWGTPGSADFAHSFETFLYELQQHRQGLMLADGIGCAHSTTPILMEITTDSSGYADSFLIRTSVRAGVELSSGSEELRHLASGAGVTAVLDALGTVANMVSHSFKSFAAAAVAFCGNGPAAEANGPVTAPPAVPLSMGLLACPVCGLTDLSTIELIPGLCHGTVTRSDDGEVRIECGSETDVDWDGQKSIGVQCADEECGWFYRGTDWAEQLAAAPEQGGETQR